MTMTTYKVMSPSTFGKCYGTVEAGSFEEAQAAVDEKFGPGWEFLLTADESAVKQASSILDDLERARAEVVELCELLRWAQHHVDRSAPDTKEFLGRAMAALGPFASSGTPRLAPKVEL